jgi:hypothetical protein
MEDDDKVPIEVVLGGKRIHPLDEGESVVSAFVLIKVKDADGDISWSYRTTDPPNMEELLGALIVQADLLRKELSQEWNSDPTGIA